MLENVRKTIISAAGGRRQAAAGPGRGLARIRDGVSAGPEWQQPAYGEYYARSADVYAAVRLRAESVARPRLVVRRRDAEGAARPVEPAHPVQRLLERPNPWWSGGDLIGATETYLSLWGAAFWRLDRGEASAAAEIWPLRPDHVRVVRQTPGGAVAGFVSMEAGRELPLLPEEVVWFRYFNPMDESAGFAPMAAARLTADMGMEALRFNRDFFRNGAGPQDLIFKASGIVTEEQVADFHRRMEQRLSGPGRWQRPIVTGDGWDVQRLGLSQRDMEWVGGLRWSLEGVARVFGVPLPLLEDFSRATYNNVREARRMFWEKTIVPELRFLESEVNQGLLAKLGALADGLEAAFDTSAIEALSENESERTERHVRLVEAGILTVNEVRRERGLPPVAWGEDRPRGGEVE
ncbi:MAG: phage portal protein [Chloroflexota bacterium]|nr:phage portal protein [Chloroflexota bacterium]